MCYLVIGSSTEPAFFHAGCRPSHHVGLLPALTSDLLIRKARPALTSDLLVRKAQHLHLINTWSNKGFNISIWSTHDVNIDTALTSDQHMMRRLVQHLRLINTWCEDWLGTYIHPDKNTSYHSDGRACTHIWSSRNQSYSHIRMALSPPRLSYLVTDQAPPFS